MLSPRELEILRLIAAGWRLKEIGRELEIRDGTVRTHVEHLRMKLEARSLPEAVARAMEAGLLNGNGQHAAQAEPEIVPEVVLEPD